MEESSIGDMHTGRKTYLNGSFENLNLDARRLIQTILFHIDNFPGLAVNTPRMLAR
jgi:hypothetical protein